MEKLGVVYALEGKINAAEAIFRKVITDFPTEYASTHINLGNCYKLQSKYEEAEKEYKRAIFLSTDNLQAYYRLGVLYDEIGSPAATEVWNTYNELEEQKRTY